MLTPHQIKRAFQASNAILSARRKSLRSYILKSMLIVIGLFFYASLLLSVNMGLVLYTLIVNPEADIETTKTVIEIMKEMGNGDYSFLGTIGILAFSSYIIFSPLIGTATLSLVSEDESVSLGLPRGYRFFNALILNMFSAVSILQLLIGFGIASIFSIEGNRLPTIMMFLLLWVLGSLASTAIGWVREAAVIRIGFLKTLILSFLILGIIGASVLLTGAQDVLGRLYGAWLVAISKLDMLVMLASTVIILVVGTALVVLGVNLANNVVSLTFPAENKPSSKNNSLIGKISGSLPTIILTLHSVVWRTKEVRRTIIIVSILSFLSALFVIPAETSIIGLLIAVPAIVSLSWLVNIFGLLGGGVMVFGGDSKKYRLIPGAALVYAIIASLTISTPILLGLLNGARIDFETFSEYISVSILNSVLLPSIAVLLAIGKPFRARLEGRGDTLVPPLVSLGYILLIGTAAMLSGTAVLAATPGLSATTLFILLAILIGFITFKLANSYWITEKIQYRIMKTINGD